ncbi:MAG: helix-turn-helix domain-containing protein [Kofleriaceae bacterium]
MSELLSVREAARCTETSAKTVRRWLKAGKVRGLRIGGEWRVVREDLLVRNAASIADLAAAGLDDTEADDDRAVTANTTTEPR